MFISVYYGISNKISKIKTCRLLTHESHFAWFLAEVLLKKIHNVPTKKTAPNNIRNGIKLIGKTVTFFVWFYTLFSFVLCSSFVVCVCFPQESWFHWLPLLKKNVNFVQNYLKKLQNFEAKYHFWFYPGTSYIVYAYVESFFNPIWICQITYALKTVSW